MKRILFSLFLLPFASAAAMGQESAKAQLDFVRGLRDKGYVDLAIIQLEKLRGVPDAEVQAALPLESARLQLAQAKQKAPEQRAPFFDQASKDLQAYVKANAGKPEGVQAQLDLARLLSDQAEATLNKAMRETSLREAHEQARPAEKQFVLAGTELEAAANALRGLADAFKSGDAKEEKRVRAQLEKEYWAARVERAENYVDQGRTYIDIGKTAILKGRTGKFQEAQKAFEAIVKESKDVATQYAALAWLGKCYMEQDDPPKAGQYLDRVLAEKDKAAAAGQRLARYFYIQWAPTNPKVKLSDKEKIALVQKLAQAWMKDYPSHLKSPEGQGVQWELAESFYREGNALWQADITKAVGKEKDKAKIREIAKKVPPPKGALDMFDKAQRFYDAIAPGDSDFAEKANQRSIAISFQKLGEAKSVASLRDFHECFLKAQFEMMRMRTAQDEGSGKDSTHHLKQALKALRRGLTLADARTPPSKVDEARYLLTSAYLVRGDHERAAVLGEFMAHLQPPTKRSPSGAGYALEAYAAILNQDNTPENRARLRDLATFVLSPEMQKHWAAEPVTAVAHYQLAMAYLKDQDGEGRKPYAEAIAELEKLGPTFPGYLFAQGQLVFVALEARDQKELDPKVKEHYTKVARAALDRIKDLPAEPDSATASMFFSAKLEKAKFLYEDAADFLKAKKLPPAAAKYAEMQKVVDDLKAQMDKQPEKLIPEDTRREIAFSMGVLKKYAAFGLAEVEYREGRYEKVLAPTLTGGVLDQVRKTKPDDAGKIRFKDFQVISEILGLALRAQVQLGKVPEAKGTFKLLEALEGEAGDIGAGMTNVLRELVDDLQVQLRELKASGDAKRLKDTVTNFSAFLKDMAERPDKKALPPNDLLFLANCFTSLEQYDQAANLFKKFPAPEGLLKKPAKAKFTDEEEGQLYTYWRIQIEYAKTLRLGKSDLKEAHAILEKLLNHEHGRFHLMARKEKLHVFEDNDLYGTAIKGWTEMLNDPFLNDKLADDTAQGLLMGKKAKEVYFESYFHYGYSVYKYARTEKAMKAGITKKYTEFAAKHLLSLKNAASPEGWRIIEQRVQDLLATEAPLREVFEAMDKKK